MGRGMEKKKIYLNNEDRKDFIGVAYQCGGGGRKNLNYHGEIRDGVSP